MHTSELFRIYISVEKSFNQATLMEAKLVRATDNDLKPPLGTMPYVPLFLAPICFMIVWAIVVFTVSSVCKVRRDGDGIVAVNHFKHHP